MRSKVVLVHGWVVIVAIGCSRGEPSPPAATGTGAGVVAAATAAPSAEPPAATASRPAPIASTEGEIEGVRVEVTELKRSSGGTVSLKFTLINDSNPRAGVVELANGSTIISLVDPVGRKQYFVAMTGGSCVCSANVVVYPDPGSRKNLWAKFPAPPDEVKRVSVVIPGFAPMDDLPLD